MPLSCKTAALPLRWSQISLSVVAIILMPGALAADTDKDSQKSIISVPSTEDFIRPNASSDGLGPRHGDFRYMKMDYAKAQREQPDTTKDNSDTTPPQKKSGQPSNLSPSLPAPPGSVTNHAMEGRSMRGPTMDLTPLNLTAEQKQKFQDNRRETLKKMGELHKALKTKRDDLNNALFDPDSTETTLRDKREEVTSLHEQIDDLRFEELIMLRSLLTAEQKKHLPEIKPQSNKPPAVADSGKGSFAKPDAQAKTVSAVKGDLVKTDAAKTTPKALDQTKQGSSSN